MLQSPSCQVLGDLDLIPPTLLPRLSVSPTLLALSLSLSLSHTHTHTHTHTHSQVFLSFRKSHKLKQMLLWIPSWSSPSIHYQTPPQMHMFPRPHESFPPRWYSIPHHSTKIGRSHCNKFWNLCDKSFCSLQWPLVWPAPSLPVFRIPPVQALLNLPTFPWLLTLFSLYPLP